jgi:hypothetical protein
LATSEAVLSPATRKRTARASQSTGIGISAGLTVIALAIHGYHPFAEDGGVYLAGVERLLHPGLFPYWSGFVTAHLHFSLFAPAVVALVHLTHMSLMAMMLTLYAFSTWLTLFAAWLVVERCTESRQACCGAVALLALTLTVPVAGTSLMLMDPYVTARSFSTPLGLLALAGALDVCAALKQGRMPAPAGILLCTLGILLAGMMHPLMAAYTLGSVLLLVCMSLESATARVVATALLCGCAVLLAACCAWLGPSADPVYVQIAHTRAYWFVGTWRWYELFGLAGPLLVMAGTAWLMRKQKGHEAWTALTAMSAALGGTAIVVAVLFARWNAHSFVVAKLQPLRAYQIIYALMILALGALIAERVLKHSMVRWAALLLVVGGGMAWVQTQIFPHSAHLEFPWEAPRNGWEQAFVWVRDHTSQSAVIALDSQYISAAGEDSQNFRAIAERSAVPDDSKDGGVASIAPALAQQWLAGERAQTGLNRGVGQRELARLRAAGASWFVVPDNTPTIASCDYAHGEVKVCRVSR